MIGLEERFICAMTTRFRYRLKLAAVLILLRGTLTLVVQRVRGWLQEGSYRPEAHYMRGPGPKSHARAKAPNQATG